MRCQARLFADNVVGQQIRVFPEDVAPSGAGGFLMGF
jgi:hypothetical protein